MKIFYWSLNGVFFRRVIGILVFIFVFCFLKVDKSGCEIFRLILNVIWRVI